MPEATSTDSSDAPLKADVQKALLAAFGDEAMDWLEEDEELELALEGLSHSTEVPAIEKAATPESNLSDLLEEISAAIDGSPADGLEANNEFDDEDDLVIQVGPRYVVFEVGGQRYGIPLNGVLEIDHCGKVTALPRTPNWLRGVTNLRGQILSVTDFRELLGLADQRRIVGEKMIVVHSEVHDARTALLVDRVLGIRNLLGEQGSLEGLSDRLTVFADSLAVTDKTTTVLIDPDRLLGCNELAAFNLE